jgi:hypothetical protein
VKVKEYGVKVSLFSWKLICRIERVFTRSDKLYELTIIEQMTNGARLTVMQDAGMSGREIDSRLVLFISPKRFFRICELISEVWKNFISD